MLQVAPLLLPSEAEEPATFCTRTARLQNAIGDDVSVPGQPVLWLAQRALLRPEAGSSPSLPHSPVWWAGDEWREFEEAKEREERGGRMRGKEMSEVEIRGEMIKTEMRAIEGGM